MWMWFDVRSVVLKSLSVWFEGSRKTQKKMAIGLK